MKKQGGITLIALVITIIVLLILAGVSISLVIGQNGVLTQAKNAVGENQTATAEEEISMAWGSLESEYWSAWANNSSTTRSSIFTKDNIEKYLQGTVDVFTYNEDGTGTITYKSNSSTKTNSENFAIDANGTVNLLGTTGAQTPTTTKEWEIVTDNGDTGLSLGDLLKPKNLTGDNAYLANEKFYVIGKNDTEGTVALLAEKNVKTNDETINNIQSASANKIPFDSSANETNIYANATIKGMVDTYVGKLTAAGLTLEDVEVSENPNVTTTAKGRLMWGTNSSGEVQGILGSDLANKSDIIYGPDGAKISYWLGSPFENTPNRAWRANGEEGNLNGRGVNADLKFGLRPVIKVLQSKI